MSSERHVKGSSGGISWFALLLGLAFGVTVGIFYAWEIDPVILRQTEPEHLNTDAREDYVVAIALSYAQNHNLQLAFDRLRTVSPDRNVWDTVAEVACRRLTTGKTVTNADIRVIRALKDLYKSQGASDCADDAFPTPLPPILVTTAPTLTITPTLTPPFTKTPTPPLPTPTPAVPTLPTSTPPSGSFSVSRVQSFCDPNLSGIIEVRVYDRLGQGVPGVRVQVLWAGNQGDTFYTGLKPEREPGYADFEMSENIAYTVIIPDLKGSPATVEADQCDTNARGEAVLRSYRVNFEQGL